MKSKAALFRIFILLIAMEISSCGLFDQKPTSAAEIIEKASHQKVFLAPYDLVWKAAHSSLKYTIASENQDYGTIETDYIKAVDGWLPPYKNKPDHPSSRYKLVFTFAKGKTAGQESVRVTIDKKIEAFKDVISETQIIPTDGLEEASLFYRMEREIVIADGLKKAFQGKN